MNRDIIQGILDVAVYAPSGENSQPWRFEVKEGVIYQYNIPERDNPVYNYRQRGSYFAHGAVLENIILLSEAQGYKAQISLLPNGGQDNLVAKISFEEGTKTVSPLIAFIKKRATNRKAYKGTLLTSEQKQELLAVASEFEDVEMLLVESTDDKKKLAGVFSNNDRIMLENKSLHDSVFHNICWTEQQEKERKSGLYAKTMELQPPQLVVFKLLKNWSIAKVFRVLGMTKFIAKENAKVYRSGAAYLAILVNNDDVDYIKAGMLTQKLWLTIVKFGLSAHPLAALPYLYERAHANSLLDFEDEHVSLIKDSYAILKDIYKIADSTSVAMTLRVGDGGMPTAFSSRKMPEIV